MNQNSPAPSISNAKERKVSSLGLNINLIQFTKFLSTFGIVLSPFLFGTSIACLWSGSLGKWLFFVPGIFFLILSGFFLFLCINLKTRCDIQDIDGIENIASAYTPVPGGVGPMTINTLILQTLISAEKTLS